MDVHYQLPNDKRGLGFTNKFFGKYLKENAELEVEYLDYEESDNDSS